MTYADRLRASVFAGIEEARAERRSEGRARYALRKRQMVLRRQRHLWMACCPVTGSAYFSSSEVRDVEAWARLERGQA